MIKIKKVGFSDNNSFVVYDKEESSDYWICVEESGGEVILVSSSDDYVYDDWRLSMLDDDCHDVVITDSGEPLNTADVSDAFKEDIRKAWKDWGA